MRYHSECGTARLSAEPSERFMILLLLACLLSAPPLEGCSRELPANLVAAVRRQFPDYRLPTASDNEPSEVALNIREGGTGCLGVTSGDYNADGRKDFALLLTARHGGDDSVLIAAIAGAGAFTIVELTRLESPRQFLYVATLAPAHFQRTPVLESPLGAGELYSYRSPRPGIAVGESEAWEKGFFFTPKETWVYVHLTE